MQSLTIARVNGRDEIILSYPHLDTNDRFRITVKGRNGQVLDRLVHDHRDDNHGTPPPPYHSVIPPHVNSSSDRSSRGSLFGSLLTLPSKIVALLSKIFDKVMESFWGFLITRSCSQPFGAAPIVTPRAEYLHTLLLIKQIHFLTHIISALGPFAIGFAAKNPERAMGMLLVKWLMDGAYLSLSALFKYLGGPQLLANLSNIALIGYFIRPILRLWNKPEFRLLWQIALASIYLVMIDAVVMAFYEVPELPRIA